MAIDKGWLTEECSEAGLAFSMKLKEKIYEERTRYQLIEIYETEFFGTVLVLDGFVMLTDLEQFYLSRDHGPPRVVYTPESKKSANHRRPRLRCPARSPEAPRNPWSRPLSFNRR